MCEIVSAVARRLQVGAPSSGWGVMTQSSASHRPSETCLTAPSRAALPPTGWWYFCCGYKPEASITPASGSPVGVVTHVQPASELPILLRVSGPFLPVPVRRQITPVTGSGMTQSWSHSLTRRLGLVSASDTTTSFRLTVRPLAAVSVTVRHSGCASTYHSN